MSSAPTQFDAEATRARLAGQSGRELWRSLDELAHNTGFRTWLENEHPPLARGLEDLPHRRDALKYLAASLALAGATSCTRQPEERIVPWSRAPEQLVPGRPRRFATAMPWSTGAIGLLVESHMGRPTKVEGNPDHPASLGATDTFAQASVLSLYDPDRTQVIEHRGRIATWDGFLTDLKQALTTQEATQGAGLRILTPTVTSPTLARQLRELLARWPGARWHQWDPVSRDPARRGAIASFGRDVEPQYRFERADVIVSLDADFLGPGPASVRATREFTRRRKHAQGVEPNRLYVVEGMPSTTGAAADHRLPARPTQVARIARDLLEAVAAGGGYAEGFTGAVARDLLAHTGASLVLAGEHQPPEVHRIAHALNQRLGNTGKTVLYTEPVAVEPVDQLESLQELVADMNAGDVAVLAILGGNPVYDTPADLDFAAALEKVALRIHLGSSTDETSNRCDWHVPQTTFLEAWSDTRAHDGTATIVQPLIAPLYFAKSDHELVAALAGVTSTSAYELVRDTWRAIRGPEGFDRWWDRVVHDGAIPGSAFTPLDVRAASYAPPPAAVTPHDVLEIDFRPDPSVWDGRFANNGWLQELPKPLTRLTWDNAVHLSPATAERLGVRNEDVVELTLDARAVTAPIWVTPGHADGSLTVHLGYGRTVCGSLGRGVGFDAGRLRRADGLDRAIGVELRATGDTWRLASTQDHDSMEGRDLVRVATVDRFRADPGLWSHGGHGDHDTSMYPRHEWDGQAWGMVIDLNACTACNACVVACQAENNIPIVGKDQVARGREMHWIRIDRYFEGDAAAPAVHHQPVPCMHCENAPCEVVCPVNATVHSAEGLNDMVYNRCVGTRYCANNCPYKVRRFNFYHYADYETESLALQRNPDVTVRSRGVMEKCTYCVQRINAARIQAKKDGRPIADGEVRTACQQVCPADAIAFGDINDPGSAVARLRASPLEYGLLEELNTRPRTTYLAKLMNPNPELSPEPTEDDEHGGHGG